MDPILATEVLEVSEAVFSQDKPDGDAGGKDGKMHAKIRLIKAGRAKGKNRDYTPAALQKAVKEGIYNGQRMFVNHSDKPPTSRSLMEMVSAVESTEWDARNQAVVADVEIFDKNFFDYASRAHKHMGVSADHRIGVTYVQEGKSRIERVGSIIDARSVDWVVYPAAGGEVLKFATESEGADQVEWNDVTLDQLKEHAPALLEEFKKSLPVQEGAGPDDDPEEDPKPDAKKGKKAQESVTMTRDEIAKLVQEQVSTVLTASDEKAGKIRATTEKVRTFVSKSGLPSKTQARLVNQFAAAEDYNETQVKEAVDSAKEELKEAGLGPRTNLGPSGGSVEGVAVHSVRESVESSFGIKKADPDKDDKKKE
jgi:hypothetical protein